MALPFLPANEIQQQFKCLRDKITTPQLTEFINYLDNIWITSNSWPPTALVNLWHANENK
jgi:hypothetical protein